MLVLWSITAWAKPEAPAVFCEVYDDAPHCAAGETSCSECHDAAGPPVMNPYGDDVAAAVAGWTDFEAELPAALESIEAEDSDGDGLDNLAEIEAGTWPGSADETESECSAQTETYNPFYALGGWDAAFAWKRVMHDFCGRRPRYEEVQAFEASSEPDAEVSSLLSSCLLSPYWDEVLWEIGYGVVNPLGQGGDINPLGNFEWDLRLFAYATSGDRDAGDLLAASYVVVEEPANSGVFVAVDDPRNEGEEYSQPLSAEHRFGLVTTRYSLAMRVMFSDVPRNLASHYYRELLGFDISLSEGLYPIDEQPGAYHYAAPADVDDKGVWQEECAGCHTTLDPLAYPWARYNGIDLTGDTTGTWIEERAADILPTTEGWILGERVSGPEEWVAVAIASDAFAEQTTLLFWEYLLQREPFSCEEETFEELWVGLRDNGRNVESMLHELVLTEAYGRP